MGPRLVDSCRSRASLTSFPLSNRCHSPKIRRSAKRGDGRQLPFRDAAFDVVFSNSVIEHVGDAASQERFAREVARVGRSYWVQTPNRWFPVEQHLLTPLVHWLPRRWQRAILRRGTVWEALTRPTPDRRDFYIEHFLSDVRLPELPPGRAPVSRRAHHSRAILGDDEVADRVAAVSSGGVQRRFLRWTIVAPERSGRLPTPGLQV
jgi:hypothetical protein